MAACWPMQPMSEATRVAAGQIARLFAGAMPADIPFVQPTKFQLQLIANVKAAQAIGLTLPQSLLLRSRLRLVGCYLSLAGQSQSATL